MYTWLIWFKTEARWTKSFVSAWCFRYKDNPFTVGDSFGSRWDMEGGTASFTTSWALEKDDPKDEVTISSIQPIGERYLHRSTRTDFQSLCLVKLKPSCDMWSLIWSRLPSRRKADVSAPVSESSEARQKFANAKAISSDMFFGRESSAEVRKTFYLVSSSVYKWQNRLRSTRTWTTMCDASRGSQRTL